MEQEKEAHAKKLAKVMKKHSKLQQALLDLRAEKADMTKELRDKLKAAQKSVKKKTALVEDMEQRWETLPKGLDRSKFLRIVADMSSSLRKQQEQIDAMVAKTNELLEESDAASKEVASTFEKLDKDVYKNARDSNKDLKDFSVKNYNTIVKLRETYGTLIEAVTQRGAVRKEQHDIAAKTAKLLRNAADKADSEQLAALESDVLEVLGEIEQMEGMLAADY